jgi:hypothetical protein
MALYLHDDHYLVKKTSNHIITVQGSTQADNQALPGNSCRCADKASRDQSRTCGVACRLSRTAVEGWVELWHVLIL